MLLSEGVEWAVHCTTVLALLPPGRTLSATRLAEFHDVPGPYLAKHLQALARAGIVESERGPGGGYRLGRRATEITLLDVVEAIDGAEPSFRCTEIRRRGPTAATNRHYTAVCGVHAAMLRADVAWRAELRQTSVQELADAAVHDASPTVVEKGLRWFEEVLR